MHLHVYYFVFTSVDEQNPLTPRHLRRVTQRVEMWRGVRGFPKWKLLSCLDPWRLNQSRVNLFNTDLISLLNGLLRDHSLSVPPGVRRDGIGPTKNQIVERVEKSLYKSV